MRQSTRLLPLAAVCAVALCLATGTNAGIERWPSKEMAAAPIEEPFSWTGFYAGGSLGANWADYDFSSFTELVDIEGFFFGTFAANDFTKVGGPHLNVGTNVADGAIGFAEFEFPSFGGSGSDGGFDVSNDGLIGGGQLGYNRQFGHFVVGIEGDFQRTSTHGGQTFSGTETFSFFDNIDGLFPGEFVVTDLTTERKAEMNWTASARGRLGYANGHVLFYVTGGVAFADVKVIAQNTAVSSFYANDILIAPGGTSGFPGEGTIFFGSTSNENYSSRHEVLTGWTGGIGGEWAVNDMCSIGMEYRHADFGSHTYEFSSNGGPVFPGDTKVDVQNDQVTVRFNILLSHFLGK